VVAEAPTIGAAAVLGPTPQLAADRHADVIARVTELREERAPDLVVAEAPTIGAAAVLGPTPQLAADRHADVVARVAELREARKPDLVLERSVPVPSCFFLDPAADLDPYGDPELELRLRELRAARTPARRLDPYLLSIAEQTAEILEAARAPLAAPGDAAPAEDPEGSQDAEEDVAAVPSAEQEPPASSGEDEENKGRGPLFELWWRRAMPTAPARYEETGEADSEASEPDPDAASSSATSDEPSGADSAEDAERRRAEAASAEADDSRSEEAVDPELAAIREPESAGEASGESTEEEEQDGEPLPQEADGPPPPINRTIGESDAPDFTRLLDHIGWLGNGDQEAEEVELGGAPHAAATGNGNGNGRGLADGNGAPEVLDSGAPDHVVRKTLAPWAVGNGNGSESTEADGREEVQSPRRRIPDFTRLLQKVGWLSDGEC